MNTQLLKQFSSILTLTLISLFFTSSTPGYDENGNDIDECAVYQPCPEGYTCLILLEHICVSQWKDTEMN